MKSKPNKIRKMKMVKKPDKVGKMSKVNTIADARIVIRLFSGLPNPQWKIDPEFAKKVLNKLKSLPPVAQAKAFKTAQFRGKPSDVLGRPRSGYRGFSVYAPNSEKRMADFQIFGRLVLDAAGGTILKDTSDETWESLLYQTAPQAVRRELEGVSIQQLTAPGNEGPIEGVQGDYEQVRCDHAPRYLGENDDFNDFSDENHCYNYATRVLNEEPLSSPAIPGNNNSLRKFSVRRLRAALAQDELENMGMEQPTECPPEGAHYIAAMVRRTASGRLTDIHFLRMDRTGRWSHKDGDNTVENTDDNGDLIRDLKEARLIGNCKLAGFYLAFEEHRDQVD